MIQVQAQPMDVVLAIHARFNDYFFVVAHFAFAKGPPGKGSYGEVSISTDRSCTASASAACDRRHKLASNTPLIFGRREIGSDATPHPRRWEERAEQSKLEDGDRAQIN
jgi:hypothetical protein